MAKVSAVTTPTISLVLELSLQDAAELIHVYNHVDGVDALDQLGYFLDTIEPGFDTDLLPDFQVDVDRLVLPN